MTGSNTGVDARRIQSYLRANAMRREDRERIGPFCAGFDAHSANPYLNYAVPEDGAAPAPSEIVNLVAAFERRGRKPRLEFVPETAPGVEPALLAAGFVVENRFPLLVCIAGTQVSIAAADVRIEAVTDDDDIAQAVEVGAEAYAMPHHSAPLRRMVGQGGVLMLARETQNGIAVGAGMATPAQDGVTEVAGIGVRAAWRRRGIASALTSAITCEAFRRGASLAWLTPGHDDAERIYRRAGFLRQTEQLHISKPA
jgi:ribosomal protein S18 acetylase RimI-like enzyme